MDAVWAVVAAGKEVMWKGTSELLSEASSRDSGGDSNEEGNADDADDLVALEPANVEENIDEMETETVPGASGVGTRWDGARNQ